MTTVIHKWTARVERVKKEAQSTGKLFINPRRYPLDYQAALESVGKGLLEFDGCYFRPKASESAK